MDTSKRLAAPTAIDNGDSESDGDNDGDRVNMDLDPETEENAAQWQQVFLPLIHK